jgi:hypothetical protein
MAYKGSGKKGKIQGQIGIGGDSRRSEIRIGDAGPKGGKQPKKSKGFNDRKDHDTKGRNTQGRNKW